MAQVLTTRMEQLLRSDDIFISQIEDVSVNARVKEPYSLWRKMLRYRKEMADMRRNCRDEIDRRPTLSLKWVPDTLALRVVLSAMRLSRLEDDESLRTREKMLCFYALQLISDVWPSSMAIKDYITNPKKNGYQSLHYSASMMIGGEEWPFEVQVRSEEMHKVAEYGEWVSEDCASHHFVLLTLYQGKPLTGTTKPKRRPLDRFPRPTPAVYLHCLSHP